MGRTRLYRIKALVIALQNELENSFDEDLNKEAEKLEPLRELLSNKIKEAHAKFDRQDKEET